MNSSKAFKVIVFMLAAILTLQVILVIRTEKLIRTVKAFEPVVVVKQPEQVEQIETEPETKTETGINIPLESPIELIPETVTEIEITEEVEIQPRINCRLDDETQQMILDKCEEYDIDFAFTMAVIFKESSFRSDADSGSSVGLMQINRINHEWLSEELGITNFLDPEQNVTAGLYMLHDLFEKYEDPAKVLMAYNMGEAGARKLWNCGIYSTNYSEGILQQLEIYNAEIAERMGE